MFFIIFANDYKKEVALMMQHTFYTESLLELSKISIYLWTGSCTCELTKS